MAKAGQYKIKCLKDGKIFNTMKEVLEYYGMTLDQVQYRLDDGKEHKDGYSFIRIWDTDNTEALESVKSVNSQPFVDKFGEIEVPLPGYENRYTISTSGVIKDMKRGGKVIKVTTKVTVKNTVTLYKPGQPQVHNVENLMKKAFGDPEEN